MKVYPRFLNRIVAALVVILFAVTPLWAQDEGVSPDDSQPQLDPTGPEPQFVPKGPVPPSALGVAPPDAEQSARLDKLFTELLTADESGAARVERQIWAEWSKSGSASMDLLLERGRDAMAAGDTDAAIDHFSALIDHDPEFAEGWNGRATAYFQAGMYGESVADIAQVLRLNPRHFGAMAGFARILEETDRPKQALVVYRAALAIHPHLSGVREAIDRLQAEATGQVM